MEELKHRIEVEDLEKIVNHLEMANDVLDKMKTERYLELEEAKKKLALKRMENMTHQIPNYTAKLERLKKFVEAFIAEYPRRNTVKYTFKKLEHPYTDDFHDIMPDPLEYKLAEYNLLDMDNYIEIVFDYYNEGLKNFIEKWMTENLEYAEQYESTKEMFRLKE